MFHDVFVFSWNCQKRSARCLQEESFSVYFNVLFIHNNPPTNDMMSFHVLYFRPSFSLILTEYGILLADIVLKLDRHSKSNQGAQGSAKGQLKRFVFFFFSRSFKIVSSMLSYTSSV